MTQNTPLKHSLQAGRPALGCFLNMANGMSAEICARAGFDMVLIDCEHGPGDITAAIQQMQAANAGGCPAMVRVPWNDTVYLKRILDAGAEGVMIPAISTGAEAQAAVAACRYPPRGVRGIAYPIVRASRYGTDLAAYLEKTVDELLIMAQIETRAGVENAAAIAGTDGIDLIFVGPMDLSASLGYFGQPDHPEVRKAIDGVKAAVKQAGKLIGIIPTPEYDARTLFGQGFDLVLDGADVAFLRDGALAKVRAVADITAGK
ncbi:HpcH/HpaI aldolase family protein [Oceanibaculum indicum]|uniref:4-hydroxy-2-oxoheptanedioate aldolase n=1 Tax=Oceanibaculum indicum TaxID=526216 RepID=A0A420WQW4_9PROT|nr:aldolase/citrate lyase family protein [Oceanibaculum indicum]RKQ73256.1 4-hydroxy-2-oxoheptanedioate aldolase [Oceanibaculum indicum]